MNTYIFAAFRVEPTGIWLVATYLNGRQHEVRWFETEEWALFFKRTCEALDEIRYSGSRLPRTLGALAMGFNSPWINGSVEVYSAKEIDAMLKRITSLEHWLEPLRNTVRRFFDLLMWGERGKHHAITRA
jgi:hypothetical protein